MTVAEVRNQIRILTNAGVRPILSQEQLDFLLTRSRLVDAAGITPNTYEEWTPLASFSVDDAIVPSSRNGYYYVATVTGLSGATEPVWPTGDGETITDGAVTWIQTGSALWVPTYNIYSAVSLGWLLKAGNCAHQYDVASYDQRLQRSQAFKNCMEQSATYKKMAYGGAGTIETPSRYKDSDYVPIIPTDMRWPEPGAQF